MITDEIKITYIGGPTALLEIAGLKFLADPTLDAGDTDYKTPYYTLHKSQSPKTTTLGEIDFVLLSHDHHFDNLDNAGRELLDTVKKVYTTPEGAERLGENAIGLKNWETIELVTKDNRILQIIGTRCRHGPVDGDRGPVTGFILKFKEEKQAAYVTGDTVLYEGVKEVARRFDVRLALVFMGAAIVKGVGKDHLTMTAEEGVLFAKYFDKTKIFPLHYEGWTHFSESRKEIEESFLKAGLLSRLRWN